MTTSNNKLSENSHYSQKRTASLLASPTSFERTMGVTSSTDSDVACVVIQSSATSSSKRFPRNVQVARFHI